MANEGYRKRLEEWLKTQKTIEVQKETPYNPSKMRSRAPLGCLVMAVAFVLWVIYKVWQISSSMGK